MYNERLKSLLNNNNKIYSQVKSVKKNSFKNSVNWNKDWLKKYHFKFLKIKFNFIIINTYLKNKNKIIKWKIWKMKILHFINWSNV